MRQEKRQNTIINLTPQFWWRSYNVPLSTCIFFHLILRCMYHTKSFPQKTFSNEMNLLNAQPGKTRQEKQKKRGWRESKKYSLRASSPIWASEGSLGPSLACSREAHFTCPNRRACSQATKSKGLKTRLSALYAQTLEAITLHFK